MKTTYFEAVIFNLTGLKGDVFKMVAENVRSSAKNVHGFRFLRGMTDKKFKNKEAKLYFRTEYHLEKFLRLLKIVLREHLIKKIELRRSNLRRPVRRSRPYRFRVVGE